MRQTLCVILCAAILAAGCAGRKATPISIQRLGDERRSAEAIHAEMASIDDQIAAKQKARNGTVIWNIFCGVTGFVVIIPWFLMNLKDAEGTEIEALKQRQIWLTSIIEDQAARNAATIPAGTP